MQTGRSVGIGPWEFVAHELTVGEIRSWLAGSEFMTNDAVGALLFDDFDLRMLAVCCSVEVSAFDPLTASQLRKLEAHCKAVNADFFAMRQRMVEAHRTWLAANSKNLSAPLSASVMLAPGPIRGGYFARLVRWLRARLS